MGIENSIFNRLTLLLGTETMDIVARQRVIIFGVGGVGSWCAESLVRSGIRHPPSLTATVCASPTSTANFRPLPEQ